MAINEKINKYSNQSCTYENQKQAYGVTMMRENTYLGGEPICAIKRRVSAQLRNNFEHVIEQNKSIMHGN